MLKRILVGVIAATAWLVNPMLGCSGGDDDMPEFAFGESEMRAAVQGTYKGQLPTTAESITLELDEATAASSGTTRTQSTKGVQCGTRTFIQAAAACVSMTEMPLEGTITLSGTTLGSGVLQAGRLVTYGRLLDGAQLSLTLPDGATMTASYDASKETLVDWLLTTSNGPAQRLELSRSR